MMYSQYLNIAGVRLKFNTPVYLSSFDDLLVKFACGEGAADAVYTFHPLVQKPALPPPLYKEFGLSVHETESSVIRSIICGGELVYTVRNKSRTDEYDIYASDNAMRQLSHSRRLINITSLEEVMLGQNAFMLHAAVVVENGRAVVLTAPPGTGKSTHSALWSRLFGSFVINGDCAVIKNENGVYYAYSPPLSGSSAIEENTGAPIAAVVRLGQSEKNSFCDYAQREKFFAVYQGATVNGWCGSFVTGVSGLIQQLCDSVPVFGYSCNKSDDSANVLYNRIFNIDKS